MNTVLRFGHTVGAHAATQSGSQLGGKMKGPTIWPVFEALADGKLPNMPGVSSVPIPADVGAVMRIWISRVEQIHTEVMEQNKLLMRAVTPASCVSWRSMHMSDPCSTAATPPLMTAVLLAAKVRAMQLERLESGTVAIIDPLAHDVGEMTPDAARSLPLPPMLLAEAAIDLGAPELQSVEP